MFISYNSLKRCCLFTQPPETHQLTIFVEVHGSWEIWAFFCTCTYFFRKAWLYAEALCLCCRLRLSQPLIVTASDCQPLQCCIFEVESISITLCTVYILPLKCNISGGELCCQAYNASLKKEKLPSHEDFEVQAWWKNLVNDLSWVCIILWETLERGCGWAKSSYARQLMFYSTPRREGGSSPRKAPCFRALSDRAGRLKCHCYLSLAILVI